MSYDVNLVLHALPAVLGDPHRNYHPYDGEDGWVSVWEFLGATYNYQPALASAGLASLYNLHRTPAGDAISVLDKVLARIIDNPEHSDLIRGSGTWGNRDTLIEFLTDFKTACEQNPDTEIRVV